MTRLFLEHEYLQQVRDVIKETYPEAVVWAYGSRVDGSEKTAHGGSDLDLCVVTFGEEDGDIFRLREAFNESNIPFLIDIFEYERLPQSFQEEINQKSVVIYESGT